MKPPHVHHWKLETPKGERRVRGYCRGCRTYRWFPASAPDLQDWQEGKKRTWNNRKTKQELFVY